MAPEISCAPVDVKIWGRMLRHKTGYGICSLHVLLFRLLYAFDDLGHVVLILAQFRRIFYRLGGFFLDLDVTVRLFTFDGGHLRIFSRRLRAVFGRRPISRLIAEPACPLARASRSFPSLMSVMMTAAVSK